LLAMVPNLFPVIIVFGVMGWGDIALQIGSIMTASAALGIAVDDTIHFLTWFRRGIDAGMTPVKALKAAFSGCAPAMFQTTLICTSGLLVFGASSFVPVLHFAYLMALLLVVALVGDLVFLPTLLASPLGAFFRVGRTRDEQASPTQGD
jgi:predicted RND superfamily exporter protein